MRHLDWRYQLELSALAQYRSRFAPLSGASFGALAAAWVPDGYWSLVVVLDGAVVLGKRR